MLVEEYMNKDPIVLTPEDNVKDAFSLLLENGVRQAPVMMGGELVGIVSDRDLRAAIVQSQEQNNILVGLIMTENPVTITADAQITEAGKLISMGRFNALPVVEESGELKGIISTTDILRCFLDNMDNISLPLITK